MGNGTITNASVTASSYYPQYPPWSARLRAGTEKGWYALPNDLSPWIQVDLGKPRWLKGLATQGKRFTVFVKTYKVAYSLDAVSWRIYHGNGTRDKVSLSGVMGSCRYSSSPIIVPDTLSLICYNKVQ